MSFKITVNFCYRSPVLPKRTQNNGKAEISLVKVTGKLHFGLVKISFSVYFLIIFLTIFRMGDGMRSSVIDLSHNDV